MARCNALRKIAAQRAVGSKNRPRGAARPHGRPGEELPAFLVPPRWRCGVCRKAAERLSTTDSPCYIPAFNAEEAAAALDTPSEYLSAACTKSSCRTAMCVSHLSLNKSTAKAVVTSLSEPAQKQPHPLRLRGWRARSNPNSTPSALPALPMSQYSSTAQALKSSRTPHPAIGSTRITHGTCRADGHAGAHEALQALRRALSSGARERARLQNAFAAFLKEQRTAAREASEER